MQNVVSIDAYENETVDFVPGNIWQEQTLSEPKDTTLISSIEAAELIHRTPQTVRRLCELTGEDQVFKTAQLVAGRWVIERWEVLEYATSHPENYTYRKRWNKHPHR